MLNITYDQKTRMYQWTDQESGQILTAPAKEKHQLFTAVVSMLDPDLFAAAQRIMEKYPQLERVAWRAIEIVCGEGVEVFPEPKNGVVAMVESSDGFGRYAIEAHEAGLTCQCEHFTSMSAPLTQSGSRYCKHILSYQLWLMTREDRF